MAEDTSKKEKETPKATEPTYFKEQMLKSKFFIFTVGQKAFIEGIPDSQFPMTIEEAKKKIGVK